MGQSSLTTLFHMEPRTDRGFGLVIDRNNKKILISFDANSVVERHKGWLTSVERRIGLGELDPQPYWGFGDLYHKAGTKLLNCFYIEAKREREEGKEYFHYKKIICSEQDIFLTRELCMCSKVVDIEILDHIIIGPSDYVSMKLRELVRYIHWSGLSLLRLPIYWYLSHICYTCNIRGYYEMINSPLWVSTANPQYCELYNGYTS